MKFSVIIFVVLQTLIQVHCEDLEVNINVKLSNVQTSSNGSLSKIICVLIKQGEGNASSVITAPTLTTTPSSYNVTSTSWTTTQLINTTARPFTTNTTGYSTWSSTTTDAWLLNDTNLTTTESGIIANATNPWWLDWWLQGTTDSSIIENSTQLVDHF